MVVDYETLLDDITNVLAQQYESVLAEFVLTVPPFNLEIIGVNNWRVGSGHLPAGAQAHDRLIDEGLTQLQHSLYIIAHVLTLAGTTGARYHNHMTSQLSQETITNSAADTEQLAERIGQRLKGGEVNELVSDLGGGKTTFVRGLARGFGSSDKVASPTYTISKVYKKGDHELHHFDFYRLQEAGLISHELAEVIGDPACTVVVEWGDVVHDVLPPNRLKVSIGRIGEEERKICFEYPQELLTVVGDITR